MMAKDTGVDCNGPSPFGSRVLWLGPYSVSLGVTVGVSRQLRKVATSRQQQSGKVCREASSQEAAANGQVQAAASQQAENKSKIVRSKKGKRTTQVSDTYDFQFWPRMGRRALKKVDTCDVDDHS